MPQFAFVIGLCICCLPIFGNSLYIEIEAIEVSGNKKTKTAIILRELNFTIGEKVDTNQLKSRLDENELNLRNTGLFSHVELSYQVNKTVDQNIASTLILFVTVKERYYLFITPEAKISGITFNNWWRKKHFSLKYLDAGVKINWKNLTGRNDGLKISANSGYTNTLKVVYQLPYFDRQKIYGIQPKIKYYKNRVALVGTQNNQQVFYPDSIPPLLSETVQSHFEASLAFTRRKDIRITKSLELHYETNTIKDTIQQLENNIPFFLQAQNRLQFFSIKAQLTCNFTDIQFYPQKGWYHKTAIEKNGLGILDEVNHFKIVSSTTWYYPFNKRWSALFNIKAQLSLPLLQPYYLTRGLGYGDDYIRAYQDYVIDGQHYAMFRSAYRYHISSFDIQNPIKLIKKIESVPINIYAKSFAELGRVWALPKSPGNSLSNTTLSGFGIGLDITSFYDLVLSVEYGFNHLTEHSIVFQFNFEY